MPDRTVRGAFELSSDQPVRGLHSIRDAGAEADVVLHRLGTTLDNLAGPRTTAALRRARDQVNDIGGAADESVVKIELLDSRLEALGRKRVTPTIDLDGIAQANAMLTELEGRLNRLDHRSVSPNVGMGGGAGAATAAGGGTGWGGGPGGMGRYATLGAAAVGLSPGVMGLLGGATALLGSAGAGALGAGAVGLGGVAPLVAGGGLTMATVRPAITAMGEITKAQEAYSDAIQEFGKRSTEAASAKRKLNAALAENPDAAPAIRQLGLLRTEWMNATQPARAQFYSGASNVLYNARQATPALGRMATVATGATAGAASSYSGFLTSTASLTGASTLVQAFATELPIAERTLEHLTQTMGQLAVAATPFFHEANIWVEQWSGGMARSTSDTLTVRDHMRGLVDSAKDWARLTGTTANLLGDIFSAGKPTGDSMVVSLTNTLDRWDQWIQRNPAKVQGFFHDAERSTSQIGTFVSHLADDFAHIARVLGPIFSRLMDVANLVSGNAGIASLLGLGIYGGLRGVGVSGGAIRGGLASYVLGTGAPAVRGATAGAGGAVVPMVAGAGAAVAGVAGGRYLVPAGGAQPGAFERVYGTTPGARYGMPVSQVPTALDSATGAVSRFAAGAARLAAPLLVINGILSASQPSTGGLGGRLQNFVSGATFGIVPSWSDPRQRTTAFLQNLQGSGMTPQQQLAAIGAEQQREQAGPHSLRYSTTTIPQLEAARGGAIAAMATGPAGVTRAMQWARQMRIEVEPYIPRAGQAQLEQSIQTVMHTAVKNAAAALAGDWTGALGHALSSDYGNKRRLMRDVDTMLEGIPTQLRQMGPKLGGAWSKDIGDWVKQMERDNPRLRRPLEHLMGGIVDDLNKLNHHTGTTMADIQQKVYWFNGQIYTGMDRTWSGIWSGLTDKGKVAQEKLYGIFGMIQQEAIDALTMMGFTKGEAKQIVTMTAHGGAQRAGAKAVMDIATSPGGMQLRSHTAAQAGRARGGMIPGAGLLDTVPIGGARAAPGEGYIANRHTMDSLSRATIPFYGKTAWQMIDGETREHSAPIGAPAASAADVNAATVGASAGSGLQPGIASVLAAVLNRWPGLSVTSTYRAGGTSYHGRHQAVDLGGDYGYMHQAADWINQTGMWHSLTEGIHNPNLSIKNGQRVSPGFWGASTWAGHANHIHLAVAGAISALSGGGAAMAPNVHLRAPRSGLGGVPGALADRGSAMYASGLTTQLNRALGAGGSSAMMGGSYMAIARAAAMAAGVPFNEQIMSVLFQKESGGRNVGPSGPLSATGPMQIIPSTFSAYALPGHTNIRNPTDSIYAAMRYISSRYGSLEHLASTTGLLGAGYHGYGRGGAVSWAGWRNRGADFVTNGPTLVGAGEGRRERVRVTPAHTPSRSGGHSISVVMQNVRLSAQPNEIKRVAEDVAGEIIKALDGIDQGESDGALMGAGA